MNDASRRRWNILDTALCSHGMVPTRADRCCYVLYSIQSRERTWKQNNSTQWHDIGNILTKPRVRTEADVAFEKKLDPLQEVQLQENPWQDFFFVDDLFGTGGTEMEQRVIARLGKDFQVGSEDWTDVTFTGQRIRWTKDPQSRSCIEVSQQKAVEELEEITVPLQCIQGTEFFWGRWQSRTQFQCCYKFSKCASKATSPTIDDVKVLNKLA